jgi:hypothetical protein
VRMTVLSEQLTSTGQLPGLDRARPRPETPDGD